MFKELTLTFEKHMLEAAEKKRLKDDMFKELTLTLKKHMLEAAEKRRLKR